MIFEGQPLAILSTVAGSIRELAALPRPEMRVRPPSGTRLGYVELTGIIDYEYSLSRREAITSLMVDESVRGIVIIVDCPGGTVSGTPELSEMVRRAAAVKPVHCVVERYMTSGAYWACCHATSIVASPSSTIGSIGVIFTLIDTSSLMENLGVKVLPVATGINKFAGLPGHPVLDDHVRMIQRWIDEPMAKFEAAVARGRRLGGDRLNAINDGSVWHAHIAKKLGLVDEVALPEDRFAELEKTMPAEQYSGLTGSAAASKLRELVEAECGGPDAEYDDDDAERAEHRLAAKFPRLVAAAEAHARAYRNSRRPF